MKNKRGNQIVNRSPSSVQQQQSHTYMGRKIGLSSNRRKSDSNGCGCGKPKQVVNKNK